MAGGDTLDDAQAAFAAQDYIAARDLALAAIDDDPQDIAALRLLAEAQLATGEGAQVQSIIDRIEAAGGDATGLALIAAEGRLQAGDIEAARRLIRNDDRAEAWRLRALAARLDGDAAAALAAFAAGRSASGEKGKLHSAEASFHLDRGDILAAARAVDLALSAAPDRVESLFVAARLADARGEHFRAMNRYLRIIEIAPLDRPALLAAISSAEKAEQDSVVRHLVTYGAQTRPMDPEFVFQLARLEARAGEWEAVRARLQEHEADLMEHDLARLLYAESLLELGQVETARAIAGPVIARRRNDEAARRLQSAIDDAAS